MKKQDYNNEEINPNGIPIGENEFTLKN